MKGKNFKEKMFWYFADKCTYHRCNGNDRRMVIYGYIQLAIDHKSCGFYFKDWTYDLFRTLITGKYKSRKG